MAENEEELKSLLMKVKEMSEKAGLKLNGQKTEIMASWRIDGETMETLFFSFMETHKWQTLFSWAPKSLCQWLQPWNKKCLLLGRKVMTNLESVLKSRDITLPTKVHLVKAMVFLVVVYGCEIWTIKKAKCQRINAFKLVLEKTLESPLASKEIKPVHPRGNQSWIFTAKTDAEAATPVLGAPDVKSRLIGNNPDAGKDLGQEEKGTTEDEMVGWHHRLNGHEFEQAQGVGDG